MLNLRLHNRKRLVIAGALLSAFTGCLSPIPIDGDVDSPTPTVSEDLIPPGRPSAEAGRAQAVDTNRVRLDGSESQDPDGDELSFSWDQYSGPAAVIDNPLETTPWITLSEPGTYIFRLTVTDGVEHHEDLVLVSYQPETVSEAHPRYVVQISVDGLRSDVIDLLGPDDAPGFHFLQETGAFTHDARTDADYSVTLPNHASQLTGRGVLGKAGHGWVVNSYTVGPSMHANKGSYVASVFDVAHDHGLRTSLFGGKSKFLLYIESYDAVNGGEDWFEVDDGRNKIDDSLLDTDLDSRFLAFETDLKDTPHHFSFFHFSKPDQVGHASGWNTDPDSLYIAAVKEVDAALLRLVDVINDSPVLNGNTTLLITSDHGGFGFSHSNITVLENFRIPFYAWGRGVAAGEDLYELNPETRKHPGDVLPPYSDPVQPIRNGDAANASCRFLGLPTVPGSTINTELSGELRFSRD